MGNSAKVSEIPDCDLCKQEGIENRKAAVDGKTKMGPWAYMCEEHFQECGVGLGTGLGQRLILAERPKHCPACKCKVALCACIPVEG